MTLFESPFLLGFEQFQRSFVLADGIEVITATLDNGLLSISL